MKQILCDKCSKIIEDGAGFSECWNVNVQMPTGKKTMTIFGEQQEVRELRKTLCRGCALMVYVFLRKGGDYETTN